MYKYIYAHAGKCDGKTEHSASFVRVQMHVMKYARRNTWVSSTIDSLNILVLDAPTCNLESSTTSCMSVALMITSSAIPPKLFLKHKSVLKQTHTKMYPLI